MGLLCPESVEEMTAPAKACRGGEGSGRSMRELLETMGKLRFEVTRSQIWTGHVCNFHVGRDIVMATSSLRPGHTGRLGPASTRPIASRSERAHQLLQEPPGPLLSSLRLKSFNGPLVQSLNYVNGCRAAQNICFTIIRGCTGQCTVWSNSSLSVPGRCIHDRSQLLGPRGQWYRWNRRARYRALRPVVVVGTVRAFARMRMCCVSLLSRDLILLDYEKAEAVSTLILDEQILSSGSRSEL